MPAVPTAWMARNPAVRKAVATLITDLDRVSDNWTMTYIVRNLASKFKMVADELADCISKRDFSGTATLGAVKKAKGLTGSGLQPLINDIES